MNQLTSKSNFLTPDVKTLRHVDNILSYLTSDGNFDLTDLEREILGRISFVDQLIRDCKYRRGEIVKLLQQRYGVSHETAYRDIRDAEFIFSSSTPLNKKYRIGVRIEKLEHDIKQAEDREDYDLAVKLEMVLQKYLLEYPETRTPQKPQNITYIIAPSSVENEVMDLGDAMVIANKALKNEPTS